MRYKELLYDNTKYFKKSEIESILSKENLQWLIDSEIENADIEIKKGTLYGILEISILAAGTMVFLKLEIFTEFGKMVFLKMENSKENGNLVSTNLLKIRKNKKNCYEEKSKSSVSKSSKCMGKRIH